MTENKVEVMKEKIGRSDPFNPMGPVDIDKLAEVLCEMEENWNWVAEKLKEPLDEHTQRLNEDNESYKAGVLAVLGEMEKCFTRTKTNSPQFKDGVDVQFNIHKFRAILDELKKNLK